MKRFLRFCFLLLFPISAFALDNGHVKYTGGTIPGVAAGVVGRLDTTSETSLTFQQAGTTLAIPCASIESFQYKKWRDTWECYRRLPCVCSRSGSGGTISGSPIATPRR